MTVINEEPWTEQDFLLRLRQEGASRYHDKHPFHVRMHQGKLSREEMRSWIRNRFYYQRNLPIKDAIVLSKLKDRADRRLWIQRIVDHDGSSSECGGQSGGIEAWLALGVAAGISHEEMMSDDAVLASVRFAVDAYVNFCRQNSWLEAVASSLTELFAPDLIAQRIDVIERHYSWIDTSGLAYFKARLSQAPRDADHALGLVLKNATTRKEQISCVAALEFKCDVLWSLLDAIEHSFVGETCHAG